MRFPHLFVLLLGVSLAGCVTQEAARRGVDGELHQVGMDQVEVPSASVEDVLVLPEEAPAFAEGLTLSATNVLPLAFRYSRDWQSEREEMIVSTLELMAARRAVQPRVSGQAGLDETFSGNQEGSAGQNIGVSVAELLWTGAELELEGSWREDDRVRAEAAERVETTTAQLNLRQPLLAGAGYTASHAAWIQAEQDVVYALRDFSRAREDFAIDILRAYYALVNQDTALKNTLLNVEQSEYLQRRSEAMFSVRMAPKIDVLRSQQQALSARNSLNRIETGYRTALRRFLIRLGLSPDTEVTFAADIPMLRALGLPDGTAAEAVGLANRLDLFSARGRLEDARRRERLARQGMLPDLSVVADVGYTDSGLDAGAEEEVSGGIRLELPFDRRDERDAVMRSRLAREARERSVQALEDTVRVDVASAIRRLRNFYDEVEIQIQNVQIAGQREANAVFRFRNGELSNRDVVEAQNDLLDARNGLVDSLINHELERLGLLRAMGALAVGPEGALQESLAAVDLGALFKAPDDVMKRLIEVKDENDEAAE